MVTSERNVKIYEMRKSGVLFTEIGKIFNISGARARQIYVKYNKINNNHDSLPPLKKVLSARMQNALIIIFNNKYIFDNPQKM